MKHTPVAERVSTADVPKPAPQTAPAAPPKAAEQPKLAEELQKMPYEPLLPIEKKLVLWSILLGVFLLVVLMWASGAFFRT
ncbi:MAG TPA: hypothetical protein VMT86_11020 [Bryobacteraceae bacterium]|nr:hypothetical protein [Bryobacteraceae bacterium]